MGKTLDRRPRVGIPQRFSRDVLMSFETGEQGAVKLYFQDRVIVTAYRSAVVKALANTDAGTVQPANSTGNQTAGLITIPLSSAIGTAVNTTPTSNQVVEAGDYVQLTSAKTTVGGKAVVTVEYYKA